MKLAALLLGLLMNYILDPNLIQLSALRNQIAEPQFTNPWYDWMGDATKGIGHWVTAREGNVDRFGINPETSQPYFKAHENDVDGRPMGGGGGGYGSWADALYMNPDGTLSGDIGGPALSDEYIAQKYSGYKPIIESDAEKGDKTVGWEEYGPSFRNLWDYWPEGGYGFVADKYFGPDVNPNTMNKAALKQKMDDFYTQYTSQVGDPVGSAILGGAFGLGGGLMAGLNGPGLFGNSLWSNLFGGNPAGGGADVGGAGEWGAGDFGGYPMPAPTDPYASLGNPNWAAELPGSVAANNSANLLGLQQMGQAAGLSGTALQNFINSGGTMGSTAAGGGGVGTGAGGSGSALQRLLNGTATPQDYASLLGQGGNLLSSIFGSDASRSAYNSATDKMLALGAPARAEFNRTITPGYDPSSMPGYTNAIDSVMNAYLRKASTGGNPFENPGVSMEANKYVTDSTALPAMNAYRNSLIAGGSIGVPNANAPNLGAASTADDPYLTASSGLGALSSNTNNMDISNFMKQLGGFLQLGKGMSL